MNIRFLKVAITLLMTSLVISSCNLPKRHSASTPTLLQSSGDISQSTFPPPSQCANPYFPNQEGDRWEYSGTNSLIGDYSRTDSISSSADAAFTQETTMNSVTYSVPYDCSAGGITSVNPVHEYAGALLDSPNTPVSVNLTSNTGTSLPATINPGDTWQQTVGFEATS